MEILCISASNTKLMGDKSTSTKVCKVIRETILNDAKTEINVDIAPLMDYELKSCILCGECSKSGKCVQNDDFNKLKDKLIKAQGIFLVVPHYSTIPSKLIIMFEKINEIVYAGWINDSNYKSPFRNKKIGIIGHGGMGENEEVLKYYHDHLVAPVANTLRSLSFKVIGLNDSFTDGVTFGLKDDSCIKPVENAVFPEIIQDWEAIEERVRPLVYNVMNEIEEVE